MIVISQNSLLIWLVVGAVAGILANMLVRNGSGGLLGDIFIGILGAIFAGWLFPQLGFTIGHGWIRIVVHATIGAIILLLLLRLIKHRL